jgi:hypothetical protein
MLFWMGMAELIAKIMENRILIITEYQIREYWIQPWQSKNDLSRETRLSMISKPLL